MSDRRPLVGGNWKMNTSTRTAEALARAVVDGHRQTDGCEVCLFPPYPYLDAVVESCRTSPVQVGGQDVSSHQDGAFTGQVSAAMLLDLGCTWTLVGHSERRHGLGESDTVLNAKVKIALAAGLSVLLCVGETLDQRQRGESEAVVSTQVTLGLQSIDQTLLNRLSIAYEPVWAIGTGLTAAPEDAQTMHERIRADLEKQYDRRSAAATRIVYGGSMKPDNAEALLAQPDVDGGLVGGASLNAEGFLEIVRACCGA